MIKFFRDMMFRALAPLVSRVLLTHVVGNFPVTSGNAYSQHALRYQCSAVVFATVSMITGAAATLPVHLYRRATTPHGARERVLGHPFGALLRRPQQRVQWSEWLQSVLGDLLIGGNAYVYVIGRDGGPPLEMMRLRPDRVRVVPDNVGNVGEYEYGDGGRYVRLPASDIVHAKLYSPLDDWYGLSPIHVGAQSIDADTDIVSWNRGLIKNAAMPSGALVSESNLTDAQFTGLKENVTDLYAGPENRGRPMVLEGGLKWIPMGMSPHDLDWLLGRQDYRSDLARIYHVPPEILGIKTGTYENRDQARREFYVECVHAFLSRLLGQLEIMVAEKFGDDRLELEADLDSAPALAEDRARLWDRVEKATHLSVMEKRELTGQPYDKKFDVWLVPIGLAPMDASREREDERQRIDRREGEREDGDQDEDAYDGAVTATCADDVDVWAFGTSERDRRWRSAVRQWERREVSYLSALRLYFDEQRDRVLTLLHENWPRISDSVRASAFAAPDSDLFFDLDDETARLTVISRGQFEAAQRTGGEAVIREAGSAAAFAGDAPAALGFLRAQMGKVKRIPKHARRRVGRVIEAGINHPGGAEGEAQIAQRIRDEYGKISEGAARTIARTETGHAYSGGRAAAMKQLDIRRHEWLSAGDGRVRTSHMLVDGERVEVGRTFRNGLIRPHQPDAPAEEIINCRCITVPDR